MKVVLLSALVGATSAQIYSPYGYSGFNGQRVSGVPAAVHVAPHTGLYGGLAPRTVRAAAAPVVRAAAPVVRAAAPVNYPTFAAPSDYEVSQARLLKKRAGIRYQNSMFKYLGAKDKDFRISNRFQDFLDADAEKLLLEHSQNAVDTMKQDPDSTAWGVRQAQLMTDHALGLNQQSYFNLQGRYIWNANKEGKNLRDQWANIAQSRADMATKHLAAYDLAEAVHKYANGELEEADLKPYQMEARASELDAKANGLGLLTQYRGVLTEKKIKANERTSQMADVMWLQAGQIRSETNLNNYLDATAAFYADPSADSKFEMQMAEASHRSTKFDEMKLLGELLGNDLLTRMADLKHHAAEQDIEDLAYDKTVGNWFYEHEAPEIYSALYSN